MNGYHVCAFEIIYTDNNAYSAEQTLSNRVYVWSLHMEVVCLPPAKPPNFITLKNWDKNKFTEFQARGCCDFRNIGQKVVRKVKLRDKNNKTLVLGNRSSATYQRSRQREACQANDNVGLLCSTNQRRASLTLKGNTTWKKVSKSWENFKHKRCCDFQDIG